MKRGKTWGQKKWIINYWLDKMNNPFSEPYSLRQAFYSELPNIIKIVPERIRVYDKWVKNFYNAFCEYLSDLVLEGKASYDTINIMDDSGASKYIYQNLKFYKIEEGKFGWIQYPMEVWVENNATYNSLLSMFDRRNRNCKFYINLISQKGYSKTQEIEALSLERSEDVTVIVNLTDFDPSGYEMPKDLQRRINQIGLDITVEHIGILPFQIPEDRKIASLIEFNKRDRNVRKLKEEFKDDLLVQKGYGYEIQALTPPEIRELVSYYITKTIKEYDLEERKEENLRNKE